jgi:phosphate transport system protein
VQEVSPLRDQYHEELDAILASICQMANLVGAAMERATEALLAADLTLAEAVIDGDDDVDLVYRDVENRAFELLARQQPVASDLRCLITSLRMCSDIERMGDLALHVAKVARRRYPQRAIPDQLTDTVREMGRVAQQLAQKAGAVVDARDAARALELERDDDAMDALHRKLFEIILAPDWPGQIEEAIDITLCGRYYERFCDHAVSVARRVVYLVTGERQVPAATAAAG